MQQTEHLRDGTILRSSGLRTGPDHAQRAGGPVGEVSVFVHGPRCHLPAARWEQIRERIPLSEREVQIIQRLFESAHESEIAESLGISIHTVHTHLGRIYRKLGVRGLPGMLVRVFAAYVACVEQNGAASRPARSGSLRRRDLRLTGKVSGPEDQIARV